MEDGEIFKLSFSIYGHRLCASQKNLPYKKDDKPITWKRFHLNFKALPQPQAPFLYEVEPCSGS